jgi:hypothetical protein
METDIAEHRGMQAACELTELLESERQLGRRAREELSDGVGISLQLRLGEPQRE